MKTGTKTWNQVLLAFALLLGCLSVAPRAADQTASSRPDELFPAPEQGMTLRGGEEEPMSLEDVLLEFGAVTGEHFVWTSETRALLRSTYTGLDRDLVVEPEQLHEVVETLLRVHEFVLIDLRRAEPRMLMVVSTQSAQRGNLKGYARYVSVEDLSRFARHPALMVSTTVHLANLDVRTLTNTLRVIVTDPNVLTVAPIPETDNVIIVGFTTMVIDLVEVLNRINENTSPPARNLPGAVQEEH